MSAFNCLRYLDDSRSYHLVFGGMESSILQTRKRADVRHISISVCMPRDSPSPLCTVFLKRTLKFFLKLIFNKLQYLIVHGSVVKGVNFESTIEVAVWLSRQVL